MPLAAQSNVRALYFPKNTKNGRAAFLRSRPSFVLILFRCGFKLGGRALFLIALYGLILRDDFLCFQNLLDIAHAHGAGRLIVQCGNGAAFGCRVCVELNLLALSAVEEIVLDCEDRGSPCGS